MTRPVPTNDWWTELIFSEFGGELWAYPMVIDPEPHGFEVRFPINFNSGGNDKVHLVLREYADWQRDGEDDGKFPWLRTFDPWIRHC